MEFDMNKMQEMLEKAQEMQQTIDLRLAETVVEADAGGGAVKARMNGKKELLSLTIAPSAVTAAAGDLTLLEDLIVAAVNAACPQGGGCQQVQYCQHVRRPWPPWILACGDAFCRADGAAHRGASEASGSRHKVGATLCFSYT